MKLKITLIAFISICLNTYSQNTIIKKVNYANVEIEVPANYIANSEYEIENENFSAQWLYLSKEMFDQNVQYQLIKQFEVQTKAKEISEISFISNGSIFKGKIYKIINSNLKYKVLASGMVNNQPLVLNLSFKNEPKSNTDLDQLMHNFIKFKD
ncbi:hypothetical protein [Flavobacterium sp.]|uniref:hypothetical protein n=1 Tax=Flavobacterium sp. TaxID=239 RepID=UPI0038D0074E